MGGTARDPDTLGRDGLTGHPLSMLEPKCRAVIDWLFRDRQTGRITIAQFPNVALGVFLGASGLRRLVGPGGGMGTGLKVIATVGLVWWAIDELARGVNPWRRLLGGSVLVAQAVSLMG